MTVQSPAMSRDMCDLFEALDRDADKVFGTRRLQIIPRNVQIRESSEVARAEVRTNTRTVGIFAKIFKPRPGEVGLAATRERFQRDCDTTRRTFEALRQSADLRAVELMAQYDGLLGVVTREAKGTQLGSMIATQAAWPADSEQMRALELALNRLGRWLAAFQRAAADPPAGRISLDAVRGYIDIRLRKLTELPRAAFTEQDRMDLLAYVDDRAVAVHEQDLREVPVHGDIVPSNVIAAPNAVTVLDFGMTGSGCRYLDIARIFTQLQFYTAKPQFRPQVIAKLQQAVLEGFDPALSVRNPLFDICAVQHVVCHLLSHARQPGRFPASLYSAHLRRRHRSWLRQRARGTSAALAF